MDTNPEILMTPRGIPLAYRHRRGTASADPTLVFLHGYKSDMTGEKATFIDSWAQTRGLSFLRFDYSGHGASGGAFEDGTIGQWLDDAFTVIDHVVQGPVFLIGSSMGGWIGLLIARSRPHQVAGFLGVAAAPDFTRWVWDDVMTEAQRAFCRTHGFVSDTNPYTGETESMTLRFFEEGRHHEILGQPLGYRGPVTLIHGQQDKEVPWAITQRIATCLSPVDPRIVLIPDGEHRLSRPDDLLVLGKELGTLLGK